MMREGLGLSRRVLAAGMFAGLVHGASACGEVTADPDAGDEYGEADGGGQAGGDDAGAAGNDAGAPPDALVDCDEGFTGPGCEECTVFVNGDEGSDSNSGRSWEEPVAGVDVGITRAKSRLESDDVDRCSVWVREGTYVPGDSREDSFELEPGVHLYGGFAGFESARGERDFETYETVLSGDLDDDGDPDNNAYHVVIGADDATLDGFTITAGNADVLPGDDRLGGGMLNFDASPALENVVFTDNQAESGGAMRNEGDSAPTLINVSFIGNEAVFGGAMSNEGDSAPTLINVSFVGNEADNGDGGAMRNRGNSAPTLINVSFVGNQAGGSHGGAMNNRATSAPTLINVSFVGNQASSGGALRTSTSAKAVIFNSILWGNEAGGADEIVHESDRDLVIRSSIIQGGLGEIGGDGNVDARSDDILDENPEFVDAPDDVRLSQDSEAAIDAGDESLIDELDLGELGVEFPDTDLGGEPRIVDGDGSGEAVIDLGAYEYQP